MRETKVPKQNQGSGLPPRAQSAERKYTMSNRKNPVRKAPVRFAVDFTKKQIIGTKTSLTKAKRPGSDEYNELCELMEAHPRFRVVTKKVERQIGKQTYKNLDFGFIENYISIQPNADEIRREYRQIKKFAANLNLSVYPYTKSWFLKKFSTEDKSFDMDSAKEEIKSAGFAAALAQTVQ